MVCYLSAEYLTGPHLAKDLINLEIYDGNFASDTRSRSRLQLSVAHLPEGEGPVPNPIGERAPRVQLN